MAADEDERSQEEMPAGSDEKGTGSPPAGGAGKEKGVLIGLGEPSSFEPEEDPDAVHRPEES
jgi:hypothetical protein